MLMDNLPRLRREPLERKIAAYKKVGGHPKSLELLEGWLSSGRLTALLDDATLDGLLRSQWEDYFLKALLAHLPEAEREKLVRLCIFETALDDDEFSYTGVTPQALQHWQALSLLQRQQAEAPQIPSYLIDLLPTLPEEERRKLQPPATYDIHPLVRDYLLGGLPPDERIRLHAWAAEFYGRPFIEMARGYAQQQKWEMSDEGIGEFARRSDGVVGQLVARTDDMNAARRAMTHALHWQAQLFKAYQYEAAGQIVTAVYDILARWGERDRAKTLLQSSINSREGSNKAVAQGNLASLLMNEGQLAQALATYEQVYATFAALDAKQQMGAVLNQQSIVLDMMGHTDQAIVKQEASLEIDRQRGDEQGQAISLHQLSIFHRKQEAYQHALKHSQVAEELSRKLGIEALTATTLHTQGLIFNEMARAAKDENAVRGHRQTAAERFSQSLKINRRIGNQSGTGKSLGEIGKLLLDDGQFDKAIVVFSEALDIAQNLGDPISMGLRLEFLGIVHERQGQYPAALEKLQQALRLAQQYSSPQEVARTERLIAWVQAKMRG